AVVAHQKVLRPPPFEALDVAAQRFVALRLHAVDDGADVRLDTPEITVAATGEAIQRGRELGRPLRHAGEQGAHVQCPAFRAAGSYSRMRGPSDSRKTCSSSMSRSFSGKPFATSMPIARMRRNIAKLEAQSRGFHCSVPLM